MKNTLRILVTVGLALVLVFALTGCKDEGVSDAVRISAYRSEDAILQLKLKYNDTIFWDTAGKETELIKNTVEKNRRFLVDFVVDIDGETVVFETPETHLQFFNEASRTELKNDLLAELAASDKVLEIHEAGKTAKITGVILRWMDREGFFGDSICYSVADVDGNGEWDYTSKGKLIYSDEPVLTQNGSMPLYLEAIDDDAAIIAVSTEECFSELQKLANPST